MNDAIGWITCIQCDCVIAHEAEMDSYRLDDSVYIETDEEEGRLCGDCARERGLVPLPVHYVTKARE